MTKDCMVVSDWARRIGRESAEYVTRIQRKIADHKLFTDFTSGKSFFATSSSEGTRKIDTGTFSYEIEKSSISQESLTLNNSDSIVKHGIQSDSSTEQFGSIIDPISCLGDANSDVIYSVERRGEGTRSFVLYPSYACRNDQGEIEVSVHGRAFIEPDINNLSRKNKILLSLMRQLGRLSKVMDMYRFSNISSDEITHQANKNSPQLFAKNRSISSQDLSIPSENESSNGRARFAPGFKSKIQESKIRGSYENLANLRNTFRKRSTALYPNKDFKTKIDFTKQNWEVESRSGIADDTDSRAMKDDETALKVLSDDDISSEFSESYKTSNSSLLIDHYENLKSRMLPFFSSPLPQQKLVLKIQAVNRFNGSSVVFENHSCVTQTDGYFRGLIPVQDIDDQEWVIYLLTCFETDSGSQQKLKIPIIAPHGISIISDIDDTVKHTGVIYGPRSILRNTLIENLDLWKITGVKEWYWAMREAGVSIHYVSNSPWQVWPVVKEFFECNKLPEGSFHLKNYKGMLKSLWEPPAERKRASIEDLLRKFPNRKFILIGDAAEQDLDIYLEMANTFNKQTLAIFIRDVFAAKERHLDHSMSTSKTPSDKSESSSQSASPKGGQNRNQLSRSTDTPLTRKQQEQLKRIAVWHRKLETAYRMLPEGIGLFTWVDGQDALDISLSIINSMQNK